MLLSEFDYHLPVECIAQHPSVPRRACRLLRLNRQNDILEDAQFTQLAEFLRADDLLIFNNTKVIPARLYGEKLTGGKVEILLERLLDDNRALVQIRASKTPKPGSVIELKPGCCVEVMQRDGELFVVKADIPVQQILEQIGEVPLPPYIQRSPDQQDRENYQTIFADQLGSVAAPTAGMHFDQTLLNALSGQGIDWAFITLHIGLATFQPVRVQEIEQHRMHSERMTMPLPTQEKIRHCQRVGGRIIAVGTTSVRCLEAYQFDEQNNTEMLTDIFIYPGYRFRTVDAMITNFHLPKSTLLMLVAAFVGKQKIMSAYQHAIKKGYRFFSYGDAMFVE